MNALKSAIKSNLPSDAKIGRVPADKLFGIPFPSVLNDWYTGATTRPESDHVFPPETVGVIHALAQGRPVLIFGPKGSGKSTLATELAKMAGLPCHRFQCHSDLEPLDLFGSKGISGGSTIWEDGALSYARRNDQMVVLDEIDTLSEAAQASLLGYIENSPGQRFALPGSWNNGEMSLPTTGNQPILATCNTGGRPEASSGYVGAGELNSALLDRFYVVHLDYMGREQELKLLCAKTGAASSEVTLYLSAATRSREMLKAGKVADAISTRSLIHWINDSEVLGFETSTKGNVLEKIKDGQDRESIKQAIQTSAGELRDLKPVFAA